MGVILIIIWRMKNSFSFIYLFTFGFVTIVCAYAIHCKPLIVIEHDDAGYLIIQQFYYPIEKVSKRLCVDNEIWFIQMR